MAKAKISKLEQELKNLGCVLPKEKWNARFSKLFFRHSSAQIKLDDVPNSSPAAKPENKKS